jgi:predicted enzyme related to lactoylglutathione lyase
MGEPAMAQGNDVVPMHTMVTVSDYDRAIAFYTNALGFTVGHERVAEEAFEPVLQLHDVKFREGFLLLGNTMLVVLCFERPQCIPAPEPASNRLGIKLLAFGVSDIDAVADRIVRFGGQIKEETRLTTQFGTQLIVTDPDGTQLELIQRRT